MPETAGAMTSANGGSCWGLGVDEERGGEGVSSAGFLGEVGEGEIRQKHTSLFTVIYPKHFLRLVHTVTATCYNLHSVHRGYGELCHNQGQN